MILGRAIILSAALLLPLLPARAEEERVAVPSVLTLPLREAAAELVRAGLSVGLLYEVVTPQVALGTVTAQQPPPGWAGGWPRGGAVNLRIAGRANLPGVPYVPPTDTPPPPPPTERSEEEAPALGPTPDAGSPDAPALAGPADRDVVPALLGLSIADAEFRAAACEMVLSVERVAGHPVGRVLSQYPEAGAPRAPGGVIKVRITAGGDAPGEAPPAPVEEVTEVRVPDLLDRSPAQAERILADLGLRAAVEEVEGGAAGRVGDQDPGAGVVVSKGSVVTVRVGRAAAPGSRIPRGLSGTPAPPPVAPGPRVPPGAVPVPIAPGEGTELPADPSLPVGFTWRAASGADGYLIEVEELGPEGWMPNARRATRTTAVVLEIERLNPSPGPIRWRVSAVAGGRAGPASAWVALR